MKRYYLVAMATAFLSTGWAYADVPQGIFHLDERRELMAGGDIPTSRAACLAIERDPEWIALPPVRELSATEGYGTDRSAEPFAWAVMVLSSRSVGGDIDSSSDLRALLTSWAEADAFSEVEQASDAYYALKRTLLPLIVAFAVEQASFGEPNRGLVSDWIGGLVRRVNHRFGTEVDLNNHRTLLDSVLAAWGVVSRDEGLFEAGFSDLSATLESSRPDGSLPLEAQRGARSAWYTRQVLASMFLIAEAAHANGRAIYAVDNALGRKLLRSTSYLANIVVEPEISISYSAVNYKPGSESDFQRIDLGFLEQRPTQRNYLAFLDIVAVRFGESLPHRRLAMAVSRAGPESLARIDEFVGGNAPCFWGSE